MILESMEKEAERDLYFQKNYIPDIDDTKAARATRQEENDSFDAFLSAVQAANIEK
ncbi:gp35 [Rhodococcus phage ReqiPine5]|uniref:Gp35 n=1 Tax=Rhodococcus phage ReqiPine5 TaxID=691963 RepID=D4P810_9CAUD|nr:gp35 [Rhodococcus phage ReqiPine5]ADD81140.1 gp35 [Rhodococcus phage ReqiPine5]